MKFVYPKKDVDLDERDYAASYGHFPLSSYNTWHGGLHLNTARAPLVAICDGRVIAYRLAGTYRLSGHEKPQHYSDGFVLTQHFYRSEKGQELRFYVLYHHLASKEEIDGGEAGLMPPKFLSTAAAKVTANRLPKGVRGRSVHAAPGGRGPEVALVPKNHILTRNPDTALAPWAVAYNAGRAENSRYHSYRYVDVFNGTAYPSLHIHAGTVTRSGGANLFRVTYDGDGVNNSGRAVTPSLYPHLSAGAVLYDLPDDGNGEPAIGSHIGVIPHGETVKIQEGWLGEFEGWARAEGYNGYFSLGDVEEAYTFADGVQTDTVVACDVPVTAGEVIGYVGRYGFKRQEEAYASHVEIFTDASAGQVTEFLTNAKGDGDDSHHKYTIRAGTTLQPYVKSNQELAEGTDVRLTGLAEPYAKVLVLPTVREVTNRVDILVDRAGGAYVRRYVAGKERIQYSIAPERFVFVNAIFNGQLSPGDKLYLDEMVDDTRRRVVLDQPDAGEEIWIDSSVLAPPPRLGSTLALPTAACCRYVGRPYPTPPGGNTYQRDIEIDRLPEETVTDDEGTKWYFFSSQYGHAGDSHHHIGWLAEDDPDLIKLNPYDWTAFGFTQYQGGDEYVYGVADYLHFGATHAFVDAVWKLADDNGDRVVTAAELLRAQRNPASAERMGKMVVQHKNEWSYSPATIRSEAEQFYEIGIEAEEDAARKQELSAERDADLEALTDKISHLMWWEEAAAAPYTPPPKELSEEEQAREEQYQEERRQIEEYYASPEYRMQHHDPAGSRKAAELDALDQEYQREEYAEEAPAEAEERQFPTSPSVWHFQPHSFVRQMRLIHKKDETPEIIFPLKVKPINDPENRFGGGFYWGANQRANMTTFNANRSGGRRHAGRDLYTEPYTEVVAIAPGKVLAVQAFYARTHEITIHHTTRTGREFIIRYGEVDPGDLRVSRGDEIEQGQVLGKTGALIKRNGQPVLRLSGETIFMIHFEHFTGAAGLDLSTPLTVRANRPFQRRSDLVDSIDILQEGYNNTFNQGEGNDDDKERFDPNTLEPSEEVIAFIKDYEKFRSNAYDDAEGYCTIGYGHLIARKPCADLTLSEEFRAGITRERATELFQQRLPQYVRGVRRDITVPLAQQEFDALVSLLFNAGEYFLSRGVNGGPTQIMIKINSGDYAGGAEEFRDVTNGGLGGLVTRRRQEIDMFLNGVYDSTH